MAEQAENSEKRRGRGPAKSFPITTYEETLVIAAGIDQHGVKGKLRRLTLFDKLGRSPDSGNSRQLLTNSVKYGLTSGGYSAEFLELTTGARRIFDPSAQSAEKTKQKFAIAISAFEPFGKLYGAIKDNRIPANDVLIDELGSAGIEPADRAQAASVFMANARYLGLVKTLAGSERLISIEHLIDDAEQGSDDLVANGAAAKVEPRVPPRNDAESRGGTTSRGPNLHIDVQVHIDSTASPEQIDQIFASMAKHLYGAGS